MKLIVCLEWGNIVDLVREVKKNKLILEFTMYKCELPNLVVV